MFTKDEFKELPFEQKKEVLEWRAKFHAKKAKATADVERVKKTGYNSFHHYAYATESDVKDGIRSILNENGLSLTNDLLNRVETEINTQKGTATKTDLRMSFVLTDTETGYFEEYTMDGVAIDNGDKGIYKAYSGTIKYFLLDMFLIPTGDDPEKDSPEIAQKGQQQPPNNAPQGNQQKNQNNGNQGPQKLDWRKILDAEKEVMNVSGKSQTEVRQLVTERFGSVGRYKDMDNDSIKNVLELLNNTITYYTTPK